MQREEEQTQILNAEDVAHRYKVALSTVYEWAGRGVIPAIRFGNTVRFRKDALYALEDEQLSAAIEK